MARRLRIAVSVFFALVAVAFAVLWVRSYWHRDFLALPYFGSHADVDNTVVESAVGTIQWTFTSNIEPITWWSWPAVGYRDTRLIPAWGWRWGDHPYKSYLVFPHLFVVLLSSAVAGISIPWFRWRFSLRTMLIATTLIAVVLGLAVWATKAPKSPPIDHVDAPVL